MKSWDRNYQLAANFYNHYHHLKVPHNFKTFDGINYDENGFSLGNWIKNLRKSQNGNLAFQYMHLTNEKIKALDAIDMIWNFHEHEWNEKYQLAKNYHDFHHHLEVPTQFRTFDGVNYNEQGIALGHWINNMRSTYKLGKLSLEKIKKLEEIKMIWDVDKVKWDMMYTIACEFYKKNGHLEVPVEHKNLNNWLKVQRIRYKGDNPNFSKMAEEEIEKLEKIGIIWDVYEKDWNEKYQLAKAFYDYYGHCNIPTKFKTENGFEFDPKGISLGVWISRQRIVYNSIAEFDENKIKRFKLLEKIGMIWDINDNNWEYMYSLAEKFYAKNHHLIIKSDFKTLDGVTYNEEGPNLGDWIHNQRLGYLGSSRAYSALSPERIEKLNKLEMVWEVRAETWEYNYELIKIYYEHYGNLKLPTMFKTKDGINYDEDGIDIKRWARYQKVKLSKGSLTEEQLVRKSKLEKLGFVWSYSENKKEIINLFTLLNIFLDDNDYVLLARHSVSEIKAKINFLSEHNLPILDKEKLNPLFFMSGLNIKAIYNLSLEELSEKYNYDLKK